MIALCVCVCVCGARGLLLSHQGMTMMMMAATRERARGRERGGGELIDLIGFFPSSFSREREERDLSDEHKANRMNTLLNSTHAQSVQYSGRESRHVCACC